MSSGPTYPIIVLTAHEFIVSNREFLELEYITSDIPTDESPKRFQKSYSPPWGVYGSELCSVKQKILRHVKDIIRGPRDREEAESDETSIISWKLAEAVNAYRQSSKVSSKKVILTFHDSSFFVH